MVEKETTNCEMRINTYSLKNPNFVISVLGCQYCEFGGLGIANRGGSNIKNLYENKKDVEKVRKEFCLKEQSKLRINL